VSLGKKVMALIDRILALMNIRDMDLFAIHETIMGKDSGITEYDFFLAYKGAEQLYRFYENSPIAQR
jgi:hypothetical protein